MPYSQMATHSLSFISRLGVTGVEYLVWSDTVLVDPFEPVIHWAS